MKPISGKVRNSKLLRNKFVIALVLFLLWITFFDQNNLVQHRRNKQRLKSLKEQQDYYKVKIEEDHLKMEELRSGEGNLEKYAREQFNMTRSDEDLFLVVEK